MKQRQWKKYFRCKTTEFLTDDDIIVFVTISTEGDAVSEDDKIW